MSLILSVNPRSKLNRSRSRKILIEEAEPDLHGCQRRSPLCRIMGNFWSNSNISYKDNLNFMCMVPRLRQTLLLSLMCPPSFFRFRTVVLSSFLVVNLDSSAIDWAPLWTDEATTTSKLDAMTSMNSRKDQSDALRSEHKQWCYCSQNSICETCRASWKQPVSLGYKKRVRAFKVACFPPPCRCY